MRKFKFIGIRVYEDECQLEKINSGFVKEVFLRGLKADSSLSRVKAPENRLRKDFYFKGKKVVS